jgi:hypothetical protein
MLANDYKIIISHLRKKVIKLLNLALTENPEIKQGDYACPVHVKFKPRGETSLPASPGSLKRLSV